MCDIYSALIDQWSPIRSDRVYILAVLLKALHTWKILSMFRFKAFWKFKSWENITLNRKSYFSTLQIKLHDFLTCLSCLNITKASVTRNSAICSDYWLALHCVLYSVFVCFFRDFFGCLLAFAFAMAACYFCALVNTQQNEFEKLKEYEKNLVSESNETSFTEENKISETSCTRL